MKRLFFFLLSVLTVAVAESQNIGIGTTTPKPSAKLDVTGTSSGLLIPSMTSLQRVSISSPAEGLLVYDLTALRLYQYQAGVWHYYITDDYWVHSSTRDRVYNLGDSVGIGTSVPGERLQVAGNIKTTGDLLTTGEVQLNNPAGILQLQNSSVNKTFIQLSGENLRMGTNSGNTTGDLIIRMNGTDRIRVDQDGKMRIGTVGVTSPTPELDVYGNINVSSAVTKTSISGNASLIPICFGLIAANGSISSGTGNFTVIKLGTGHYRINCAGISSNSVVVANPNGIYSTISSFAIGSIVSFTNFFEIKCFDAIYLSLTDSPIQFMAYK